MSVVSPCGCLSVRHRVVLDTNVVLDLLRYRDVRTAALDAALRDGRVQALTDSRCSAELERVLAYPAFSLDQEAQAKVMREYRAEVEDTGMAEATDMEYLPRCSDPDDQKFLVLAWRVGADLLTRDKALLRLGHRFAKLGGGKICKPEELIFQPVFTCAAAAQRHIGIR